ncbi:restriction endonuclease subunit S [Prosthecobacter sp.]|uniref:restriction endonuclease subunit S n=1 Tax=Prosthecobacter sp. TaxID=1965333 RepID=UPI0037852E7E
MKTLCLGDIATFISKGTTPDASGLVARGIPFLRSEEVSGYSVNAESAQLHIKPETHESLRRSVILQNDLLVTIAGARLGRAAVYESPAEANCNQAVAIIRLPLDRIDPMWVCLLLLSPKYQKQISDFTAGGAIPNVSLGQLKSIEIPDLPIYTQHSVADKLKQRLSRLREAMESTRNQLAELDALATKLVNQFEGSTSTTIGNVLIEVTAGVGKLWKTFPVLGATRNGLAPAREQPGKLAARYKPVDAGTVFYNPMRILIGSIAFVDDDDEPGITSPDYVVLKGKPGLVDSRWFYYWLRSPMGERCIQSLARGAVRERMLFNRLAEGEFELPEYDVQVKASKALARIKPMRRAIQNQLKELELLPQKLLAQVFDA